MANAKIINKKEEEVNALAEKMKDAKLILLAEYRGINVEDVTELRAKLRKSNSEYKITKNNITRRALQEAGIEGLEEKVMTAEEIITLAKLPSRETLIGMLAGGLLGTISKLAVALDQVRLQKEGAQV